MCILPPWNNYSYFLYDFHCPKTVPYTSFIQTAVPKSSAVSCSLHLFFAGSMLSTKTPTESAGAIIKPCSSHWAHEKCKCGTLQLRRPISAWDLVLWSMYFLSRGSEGLQFGVAKWCCWMFLLDLLWPIGERYPKDWKTNMMPGLEVVDCHWPDANWPSSAASTGLTTEQPGFDLSQSFSSCSLQTWMSHDVTCKSCNIIQHHGAFNIFESYTLL